MALHEDTCLVVYVCDLSFLSRIFPEPRQQSLQHNLQKPITVLHSSKTGGLGNNLSQCCIATQLAGWAVVPDNSGAHTGGDCYLETQHIASYGWLYRDMLQAINVYPWLYWGNKTCQPLALSHRQ